MVNAQTLEDDEFAVDCNDAPPQEGRDGPPDPEARGLFIGRLFCDMLGDAPKWKPNRFVRAPAGSGKSTFLEFARALLGGAAVGAVARQLIGCLALPLPTAFVVFESASIPVEGDR
jgi:hypothetical protein